MNLEAKLLELATRLLARSRKNEVKWDRMRIEGEGGDTLINRVVFPTSEFQIWYVSRRTEEDVIFASIDKRGGGEIVRVAAFADSDSPNWKLLSELYEESNRCIIGWDKVLNEIDEELKKEIVGQPSNDDPPEWPEP
jgi:hypothetical protein